MSWKEEPKKVKDSYDDGLCPDCEEEISNNAIEGDECGNCGHVFWVEDDE